MNCAHLTILTVDDAVQQKVPGVQLAKIRGASTVELDFLFTDATGGVGCVVLRDNQWQQYKWLGKVSVRGLIYH